eukprot:GHUV01004050.1.p1 GENE.GHUV01004050.1~~GHUV01004050.1.p1  ORF type:complete len:136 (+),score=14.67 GHUV01004050.1:625-1032(+)
MPQRMLDSLGCNCSTVIVHVATMLSLRQSACPQASRCSKNAAVKPFQASYVSFRPQRLTRHNAVQAKASVGGNEEKKVLRREQEPEEYWVSKSERKGANPMKDPLAIIGLTAIFLPFVLLGIAIATGLVDISVYR